MCDGRGQNEIVRVGKNSGPGLSRLWTKVHKILRQRRRSFVLSNALARFFMSSFFLQIFAIKSRSRRKTEQMQKFLASNFFQRDDPNFSMAHCYRDLPSTVSKVWLSSVCWCPSAKPGNEVESRICVEWVKFRVQFEAVSGLNFMTF